MSRSQLVSLCLRIAALFVWVRALDILVMLPALYIPSDTVPLPGYALGFVVVPALLHLVLGTLLYFAGPLLAKRMRDGDAPSRFEDREHVAAIALRIAAVFVFLRAIAALRPALHGLERARADGLWLRFDVETVAFAALLAIGAWLLFGADRIAQRWFDARTPEPAPTRSQVLQSIAFSILGVWVLVDAFPELLRMLVAIAASSKDVEPDVYLGPGQDGTSALALGLRLLVGLFLFFGGASVSKFWRWLHRAGLRAPDRNTEPRHEEAG